MILDTLLKHIPHTDTYTGEESSVTERILDTLLAQVKNLFGQIYVPQRAPPRFEFGEKAFSVTHSFGQKLPVATCEASDGENIHISYAGVAQCIILLPQSYPGTRLKGQAPSSSGWLGHQFHPPWDFCMQTWSDRPTLDVYD